jgi:hypothetical protein
MACAMGRSRKKFIAVDLGDELDVLDVEQEKKEGNNGLW